MSKICHVVATFQPYRAGTGTVASAYARELAKLGQDVKVVTPDYRSSAPRRQTQDGVEIIRLPALVRIGNAAVSSGLWRSLDDADLVHLHAPFYFGAEQVVLARMVRRMPLVISYHNDVELRGWPGVLTRLHSTVVLPRLVRRANLVLVPSEKFGRACRISAIPWRVLPHGFDPRVFNPSAPLPDEFRNMGDTRKRILFVSALDAAHDYKGLEDGIHVLSRMPTYGLVVVGDGPLREYYEKLARPLGNRALFVGARSEEELAGFYAHSDITLCPSRRMESFALVVLESLACGTPVVMSEDVCGTTDFAKPGLTGFYVPHSDLGALSNAIELASADEVKSDCLHEYRALEGSYAWKVIVRRLLGLYKSEAGL